MKEKNHSKTPPPDPLDALEREWEERAERLGQIGAQVDAKRLLRQCVERLRKARQGRRTQKLTVRQAAAWSGYSPESLREMVREGKLPDYREPGSQGQILLPRWTLPRKPRSRGDDGPSPSSTEEILDEVARRSRRDP